MNRNDNSIGSINKRLSEIMFRMYIETNKSNTEQKVFTIILLLFLLGPFFFLLPFIFQGKNVVAVIGLFISWVVGVIYALIRKKIILNKIFSVKSNDSNTEKVSVTDMSIFDNIDKKSIFCIGVDGTIDSRFYTILYNWLNDLNLLKDGKLKVYCLNGSQFKEKYNTNDISDDANILFLLLDDLNINDSNKNQFIEQRNLFGRFLSEILSIK